jgi:ribosome biogenesis GTPase / thiamine phosphate phosphatase
VLFYFKDTGGCIKGTISRVESKDYYVLPENLGIMVRCNLRGRFKKDFNMKKDKLYRTDIAVVGDYVEFAMNEDGTGTIEKISERRNYLSRKAPRVKGRSYRGERLQQVIAVNLDQVFVISSIAEPPFNNKVIDRFLVAAESSDLSPAIIINKSDLDTDGLIDAWAELYREAGYTVYITSVKEETGLDAVLPGLKGRKNLLWGHSGVGKSSILNFLFPGINLAVGEISAYHDKGIHTTVTTVMIRVDEDDTYIIDTPGVREIDPYGIRKEDLGHYFKEFKSYIPYCKFNSCTHNHEPGCAVIGAVHKEEISFERYDSYLRILETIEEDINF